ncbi:hypothetical protein LF1_25360 [Rubripirellula obstinata]|uniref:Uncharacterized protein n=1 Tax=Rubripirellula obstinata TaxID=406547 RepID=A0A5B1CFL7_9BACT|nr:hypothetical protein [Rubripirellula obstinata]KAA1259998.1 hypothetical protein LF1_25360 [Rubripirellula obstinata]
MQTFQNALRKKTKARRGATMIDVIAGSMIMSALLIPSAHLINESRSNTHRLNVRQSLLDDAEQVIEATKIGLSEPIAFSKAYSGGIDTVNKHTTAYGPFSVARTRVTPDKSILPAELVTIVVDVWHDDDSDGRLDTGEASATLRTQFAAP